MLRVAVSGTAGAEQLLRRLVAGVTGTAPDALVLERRCDLCGAAHGVPRALGLEGLHLSVSRCRAGVAAAVCTAGPVGVDVEAAGAADGVAPVLLAPGESAADLGRTWVRKEAALKALGCGLRVDPRDLVLGPPDAPPVVLHGAADVGLHDVPAPEGLVAAVAVVARQLPALEVVSAAAPAAG